MIDGKTLKILISFFAFDPSLAAVFLLHQEILITIVFLKSLSAQVQVAGLMSASSKLTTAWLL